MTTTEISGELASPEWRDRLLNLPGIGKDVLRKEQFYVNALDILARQWPAYNSAPSSPNAGRWGASSHIEFTLLDEACVTVQKDRKAELYGPEANDKMRIMQQLGFKINKLAEEADLAIHRKTPVNTLQQAAWDLRNRGAKYFREVVVSREMSTIHSICHDMSKLDPIRAHQRIAGYAGSHVATHYAAEGIIVALQSARLIGEVGTPVGFILSYALGKAAHHARKEIRKFHFEDVAFDNGKRVVIEPEEEFQGFTKSLEDFIRVFNQTEPQYGGFLDVPKFGKNNVATGKDTFISLKPHVIEPDLLAEAIYLYQSPWNFSRGTYAHQSAVYLSFKRDQWTKDQRELITPAT